MYYSLKYSFTFSNFIDEWSCICQDTLGNMKEEILLGLAYLENILVHMLKVRVRIVFQLSDSGVQRAQILPVSLLWQPQHQLWIKMALDTVSLPTWWEKLTSLSGKPIFHVKKDLPRRMGKLFLLWSRSLGTSQAYSLSFGQLPQLPSTAFSGGSMSWGVAFGKCIIVSTTNVEKNQIVLTSVHGKTSKLRIHSDPSRETNIDLFKLVKLFLPVFPSKLLKNTLLYCISWQFDSL